MIAFRAAALFFVVIVLGYWCVKFLMEPSSFLSQFDKEIWIIPVGFLFALIRYISLRYMKGRR